MADNCKPENKYPPKPCPCPEIPGPPGPQGPIGLQGPQGEPGEPGNSFSARINPPITVDAAFSMPANTLTAVPIGGVGPFTYAWNTNSPVTPPQGSTYITNTLVSSQELVVTAGGGADANKAIVTSQLPEAEGVVVCEVTDTGVTPNAVAVAYHYVKITVIIP